MGFSITSVSFRTFPSLQKETLYPLVITHHYLSTPYIYVFFKSIKMPRLKWTSASAKSLQSCSTLCNPMDCSPPASSVHGFARQEHWSGLFPSLGDLPDPGIESRSSALHADSLPSELQGSIHRRWNKNTNC